MSENQRSCQPKQHVHEVLGSVEVSGCCNNAHNHRFATVSGEAIPCEGSHVHEIKFRTDSCDGHIHEFRGTTSKAIKVDEDHHVHYVEDTTTTNANHNHDFAVATLIENPTCEQKHS